MLLLLSLLFSFQGANSAKPSSLRRQPPLKFSLPTFLFTRKLVGLRGLEPPTSRLSGVRSNHLSYKPMKFVATVVVFVFRRPLVEMRRIELLTPCLQGRCSPSWATPPYQQGIRIEIFSFPRLKVHNLSIAPSKLNNDLRLCSLWLTIGYETLFKSQVSLERRWSSRTFRYGYLVTTSP